MSKNRKYMWSDMGFDSYCKNEAEKLRNLGLQADTAGVQQIIHQRILLPNKISVVDLVKPQIKLKKKWKQNGTIP